MNRKSQALSNDDPHYARADLHNDDDEDDDSDASSYLLREKTITKAWDSLYIQSDHLLFCSRDANVELSTLHPGQIQIFKLWQVYLDNINPILKVTHTPTLQARIIDAASDLSKIRPTQEALMFSIYCVAVFSLNQQECNSMFGAPREDLLAQYQLGTREALFNCGFLQTGDRDCLTALHFYLVY